MAPGQKGLPMREAVKLVAEIIVTLGALACILVWLEIKPGDLFMLTLPQLVWLVAALILFAAALCMSGRSFYLSTYRTKSLRAELFTLKAKQSSCDSAASELTIIKATWGNQHNTVEVTDKINIKPRNGLVFYVYPEAFSVSDPAPGDDEKYVEIEYKYPGWPKNTVKRRQSDWVVIPNMNRSTLLAGCWNHKLGHLITKLTKI
jgi:hypothetical protein